MFKLVVLSALLAAAVASPDIFYGAPLAYTSTVISPARTSISTQASSVIHPSPLTYAAPYAAIPAYAHLIKKRSLPLAVSTYIAPTSYVAPVTTYAAAAPLVSTYAPGHIATSYASPAIVSPVYATSHLIKKRSAPLVLNSAYLAPSTYVAHAPLATTYSRLVPAYASAPLVQASPIYTTAHLIKKRSAPFIVPSTYIAPTTYAASPLISTYAVANPLISSPVISHPSFTTFTQLIKKR